MSEPMSLEDLHDKMLAAIPQLPRRLAVSARHLVDHPDDVVICSMREVAAQAGVAPATLVRLARTLGFADWAGLRAVYAAHLRRSPVRYADKAKAAVALDGAQKLVTETFAVQQANLAYAAEANAPETIAAAAAILAKAKRLYVAGFMSCRGPGLTFTYLCKMLRPNVELLGGEGSSLIADLAMLDEGDAVLSINFQPYGREIRLIAEAVRESGASLVSLSDSRASPLSPHAEVTLLFSPESPSFFPSTAGAAALVETLSVAVLAQLRKKATDRIQEIEKQLYASGTYDKSTQ
ncbi:MAG: MurR/RpiR family transcriptional regulator [Kiloniellaceae bacterium]